MKEKKKNKNKNKKNKNKNKNKKYGRHRKECPAAGKAAAGIKFLIEKRTNRGISNAHGSLGHQ